ncbi:MAG: YkgJ family cysteine cluster protein [Caldilineaceae bacterium]|nr:YkgJ family cysteine cluster protein [Caldilineaceae bacterium]
MNSAMKRSDIAKDAATLCISCGLCCDGTLFSHTPLDTDNQRDHVQEGTDNGDKISQPCAYHGAETGCQIYTSRPNVCRQFKCRLLRKVLESETTLDDAMSIVKMTKKQRAKVIEVIDAKAAFPEPTSLTIRFMQVYSSDNSTSSASHEKENAQLYLTYMSLVHLIKKYFRPNFQKDSAEDVANGYIEKNP